jgi:hypothetical protein
MSLENNDAMSEVVPDVPRSGNPQVDAVMDRIAAIHAKKSHDYAQAGNPYSNFEYAAKVAERFTDPIDKVFATMIGIKLARLAELRAGKQPKNESVRDSFDDLATYAMIWNSYPRP